MLNNFFNCFRLFVGIKLICLLAVIALAIVIFYQFIIALILPCFINVLVLMIEFSLFICLLFYIIFFY